MSAAASSISVPGARRWIPSAPWRRDALAALVVTLVIGGPALFTRNGFMFDFTNHLWLVYVQDVAISHHLLPTYFISTAGNGVDYPVFMFYGGTLYALTGAIAAALGDAVVVAYVGVILMAILAAYGGLVWLARQVGARGWAAHAPALAYVTSAYYVTNLYGRGAWPEFVATSTLPLLFASGWRIARSPKLELLPASLFVVAAIIFTGSHNVTLLLGSLFVAALLLGLRLGVGFNRVRLGGRHRAGWLAGLFALAVAVNAWFLLPDVLHASGTVAASRSYSWQITQEFNTPWMLFDPLRAVPTASSTPGLFVQAPDWFLLWALGTGAMLWSVSARSLRSAGAVLLVLLAVVLTLILSSGVWNSLPQTLRDMQFPYRLNTYVALAVSGLVLVGVLSVQSAERVPPRRRAWLWSALGGAALVSVSLCVWQLTVPNVDLPLSYRNRDDVFTSVHATPRTWYSFDDYADNTQRVVPMIGDPVMLNPDAATADRTAFTIDAPSGRTPFALDIQAGPYAVAIGGGVERVGRSQAGDAVVRRVRPGSGPVRLTLSPAGGSVAVGRWVSVCSVAILLLLLLAALARRGYRRSRLYANSGEQRA
jgi:hypothetical protein